VLREDNARTKAAVNYGMLTEKDAEAIDSQRGGAMVFIGGHMAGS